MKPVEETHMEKKDLFIRLAMVEKKTYDEIAGELGVERKKLSAWWEELSDERKRIEWIRNLYNRKKFKTKKFPEFYDWYASKEKRCRYCGITEKEITKLISGNLELCCYWCNNAKSDEFTSGEFKSIGREIGKVMKKRLKGI